MNIFRNRASLLGGFDSESTSCSLKNIFKLVVEIQTKLGTQAYLLENYLSCILAAANITESFNAAQEGFHAGNDLRGLCSAASNHTDSDHPFYETVKQSYANHNLNYQERETISCLHFISLADDYLKEVVPAFIETQYSKLSAAIDVVNPPSLYREIIQMTSCEDQMDQLNSMLKQRFFISPIVSCYLQGFANDLLYCLIQRDCETSKQMFQLYLDEFVE